MMMRCDLKHNWVLQFIFTSYNNKDLYFLVFS